MIDTTKEFQKLLKRHRGYLTANTLRENQVSHAMLRQMLRNGTIERISHGIYRADNVWPDPFYELHLKCPQGIFSLATALWFHDMSDRDPFCLEMTLPSNFKTRLRDNDDQRFWRVKPEFFELGATKVKTMYGNTVPSYDLARTICDCMQRSAEANKEIIIPAIRDYIEDDTISKMTLMNYAVKLGIIDKAIMYMEILQCNSKIPI